jgi:hypothetical protein
LRELKKRPDAGYWILVKAKPILDPVIKLRGFGELRVQRVRMKSSGSGVRNAQNYGYAFSFRDSRCW